jgi:hypothetical protein
MEPTSVTPLNSDDVEQLAVDIGRLCAGFGLVSYLRIVTMSKGADLEALCFIRLGLGGDEKGLAALLRAQRLDGFLVVRYPLKGPVLSVMQRSPGPSSQAPAHG